MRQFFKKPLLAAGLILLSHAAMAAELRVLTHSSFALDKKTLAEFEKTTQSKLTIIKAGDAGEMLNKLILTKGRPIADVVYGIDNLNVSKAEQNDVLEPFTSPHKSSFDLGAQVTPIDYGAVTFNYDRSWVDEKKIALPKQVEDLTKPEYKNLLVVQSPATSSTGLAFFAATLAHFGEPKVWEFWQGLKKNGVKITKGWSEAYAKEFSLHHGKRPFVLSYGSSPAAEVFYSNGKYIESPTANLWLTGASFLQVEGAAVVKGTKDPVLAKAFILFMQSDKVQTELQTSMWMYPTSSTVKVSDALKLAEFPKDLKMQKNTDAKKLQDAVKQWSKLMR